MLLRGVRGAITIEDDNSQEVIKATQELLEQMLKQNGIEIDHIASIFFSVTPDIISDFPAKAARFLGLTDTPLLCLTEIPVTGALKNCIRILIHWNTSKSQKDIVPIYLKGAIALRPDKASS